MDARATAREELCAEFAADLEARAALREELWSAPRAEVRLLVAASIAASFSGIVGSFKDMISFRGTKSGSACGGKTDGPVWTVTNRVDVEVT